MVLKRSSNLGREECSTTLIEAFDLLVLDSGEHETDRPLNNRCREKGERGVRGR